MNYFILAKIGNVNMKKAFQKTLVAGSIGLLAATAAIAGTPGTSNLLFPFISTVDTTQTFLSIVARDTTAALPVGTAAPVHITYVTRPVGLGTCSHYDGDMAMTANDQMTFEISNRTNVNALTGDTTSTPVQLPANANNRVGFAVVNNDAAGAYGTGALYQSHPLYGEARIVDTVSGLFLAYSTDDLHTLAGGNPNFADPAGNGPDANLTPALFPNKILNWFSTGAVSTTWMIEPLGTEQDMAFTSNLHIRYRVANSNMSAGGHYNNNEVFRSSTALAAVTCLQTIDRATLLDPIVATHSNNGGWGAFQFVAGIPAGTIQATNALVYKNETLMPGVLGGKGNFVTRVPVL
jgi:hypothetical protein